jgi:hypothetical protein
MDRFAEWRRLLPIEDQTIGLDEHTGLIVDFAAGMCEVSGVSSVTLVRGDELKMHPSGSKFSLDELGAVQIPEPLDKDISVQAWEMVRQAPPMVADTPSEAVIDLADRRLAARAHKDWAESDRLRGQIAALGWTVQDSKDGYKLVQSAQVTLQA